MSTRFDQKCRRCGRWEVEYFDDWSSSQCPKCNDQQAERHREMQEWNYFHPDSKR